MNNFTLSQQLQADAAIALQFQEELELLDFAEALPESTTPEELDKAAPALLRYLLSSGDRGYRDGIDAFDPPPSEENNWLYDPDEETFEGRFIDRRPKIDRVFQFTIKRSGDDWVKSFRPISGDFDGEDD